jgi:hypothetical protein
LAYLKDTTQDNIEDGNNSDDKIFNGVFYFPSGTNNVNNLFRVSATTRSSINNKIKESKDNTKKNTKLIGISK